MGFNIPISKPTLGNNEFSAVSKVLSSGMLVKGKNVDEVEKLLAGKFKRKYAVMLTSGTVSLNTATTILDLGSGDEVITSAFTFAATATAIPYVGAKVVFADIDPVSFNISPKEVEKKITKKTKAIIAIDLFGNPYNYLALNSLAKKYDLFLIEDAAQAHGAWYNNKPAGKLGDISIFSFYGSKVITSGEGGMLLTNNKLLYEKASLYRFHGESKKKKYYFTDLGYNFMPTDIQGALLLEQAKKLESFVALRNKVASYYTKRLSKVKGLVCPITEKGNKHAYCLYTIRVKPEFGRRDEVLAKLNGLGVGARVYYPVPLHLQPVWKKLGYHFRKGEFPEAEKASNEVLSLPIFPNITTRELDYVISSLISLKKD